MLGNKQLRYCTLLIVITLLSSCSWHLPWKVHGRNEVLELAELIHHAIFTLYELENSGEADSTFRGKMVHHLTTKGYKNSDLDEHFEEDYFTSMVSVPLAHITRVSETIYSRVRETYDLQVVVGTHSLSVSSPHRKLSPGVGYLEELLALSPHQDSFLRTVDPAPSMPYDTALSVEGDSRIWSLFDPKKTMSPRLPYGTIIFRSTKNGALVWISIHKGSIE